METPELATKRLRLRALRASDAPALHAAWGDAETLRWWHRTPRRDVEATRTVLAEMADREADCCFAVCEAGADVAVGQVMLLAPRPGGRAALGYLFRKDHWGRGLAAEASAEALRFAFASLGIGGVELWIYQGNTRSEAVAKKLGCRRIGRFTAFNVERREALPTLVYGLTATEAGVDPPPVEPVPVYGVQPVIASCDVAGAIDFYCGQLGFVLDWSMGEPPHSASVSRADWTPQRATVRFSLAAEEPAARPGWLDFAVGDVDRLCAEFRAAGVAIDREPTDQPWGLRDFEVLDPHGQRLRFTTPIGIRS